MTTFLKGQLDKKRKGKKILKIHSALLIHRKQTVWIFFFLFDASSIFNPCMRVSELHHCQCQHRLSFPPLLLLTAKSPFKQQLPGNPSSTTPSFRQEPITQPLRSKISPWKVLSVFIFAGNFNSLLSTASTVALI